MEFKAVENKNKPDNGAIKALKQIKISKYATELKSRKILNICFMGIAFCGKIVKVISDY